MVRLNWIIQAVSDLKGISESFIEKLLPLK